MPDKTISSKDQSHDCSQPKADLRSSVPICDRRPSRQVRKYRVWIQVLNRKNTYFAILYGQGYVKSIAIAGTF